MLILLKSHLLNGSLDELIGHGKKCFWNRMPSNLLNVVIQVDQSCTSTGTIQANRPFSAFYIYCRMSVIILLTTEASSFGFISRKPRK